MERDSTVRLSGANYAQLVRSGFSRVVRGAMIQAIFDCVESCMQPARICRRGTSHTNLRACQEPDCYGNPRERLIAGI